MTRTHLPTEYVLGNETLISFPSNVSVDPENDQVSAMNREEKYPRNERRNGGKNPYIFPVCIFHVTKIGEDRTEEGFESLSGARNISRHACPIVICVVNSTRCGPSSMTPRDVALYTRCHDLCAHAHPSTRTNTSVTGSD